MKPSEAEQKLDQELVEHHLKELIKHFDSVQIFATRQPSSEFTSSVSLGKGNFYAIYGQVKLWTDEQVLSDTKNE